MLGVLALFTTGLHLSPPGCCSLTTAVLWTGALMACGAGDRQVVEEAALVKKAIV